MGAIPEKENVKKRSGSSKKSLVMIGAILGGIAIVGLLYMTVFTAPEIVEEVVEVIAVTENGCIVETADNFAVNIGPCDAQPGDVIMAPIDQKAKERALAMLTP